MIRAVADTNVMFSSARGGRTGPILRLWRGGEFTLCASAPVVGEYRRIFTEKNMGRELEELLRDIHAGRHCLFAQNTPRLPGVVNDKDDEMFVECAAALDAHFIVSGDKHLLALGQWKRTRILNPADFLKELAARR